MINTRRSSRLRKRKYNRGELGGKGKIKEKEEPGKETEEGRSKSKKKKKKKKSRNRKRRTEVTNEPKLETDAKTTDACKRNKIEEEEEQEQETEDGGEDAKNNWRMQEGDNS